MRIILSDEQRPGHFEIAVSPTRVGESEASEARVLAIILGVANAIVLGAVREEEAARGPTIAIARPSDPLPGRRV